MKRAGFSFFSSFPLTSADIDDYRIEGGEGPGPFTCMLISCAFLFSVSAKSTGLKF